ncbi:hypothetical protein BH11GEM1_BH11GEM1_27810 [soil metagenome]
MDASLGTQDDVGPTGPTASSGQPWPGAVVMVTETVVEQVVAALARGEALAAVARAYGLDRKTVRTWGRYGGYRPRARRPTVSQLDPYRAWMLQRAPEVGFNAAVVCRELRELGFLGSSVIVRRALHPLRVAATLSRATVRFETAPGAHYGKFRVMVRTHAEKARPHSELPSTVRPVRLHNCYSASSHAIRSFGSRLRLAIVVVSVPVRASASRFISKSICT